jgi:pSer/pThr/pTyr-binding forkhead associated (FHA) protein
MTGHGLTRLLFRDTFGDEVELVLSGEPVTIGRDRGNAIGAGQTMLSRWHARVFVDGGGRWWIEDLRSAGGTYVNELRVASRHALIHDDVVRCGPFVMRFVES